MDHYNRLHEEILVFRESVRDILAEMQPIKEQLIRNITKIIKKAVPNSDVQVYGSHATKLCLPWSDIDLVIVAAKNDTVSVHNPKSVLSQITRELQAEISHHWVRQVNFVENASVPVVKVSCQIDQMQ
jgi:non-canonical poly(A) RNA polymerase PAPD5/7